MANLFANVNDAKLIQNGAMNTKGSIAIAVRTDGLRGLKDITNNQYMIWFNPERGQYETTSIHFKGAPYVENSSYWPSMYFRSSNEGEDDMGRIAFGLHNDETTGKYNICRFYFYQRSYKSDTKERMVGTDSKGNTFYPSDIYALPKATPNMTDNQYYYILSSKSTSLADGHVLLGGDEVNNVKAYDIRVNYTAGTTTSTGKEELVIGNEKKSTEDKNTQGWITLCTDGSTHHSLKSLSCTSSRVSNLRDWGSDGYLVATTTENAVGGSNRPVYISNKGVVTAINSVGVVYGGTGATTLAKGRLLIGNDTDPIQTYDAHLNYEAGTTSTTGYEELVLGNSKSSTTAANTRGKLTLYTDGTRWNSINAETVSANRTTTLRDWGDNGYFVATTTTAAVGGTNRPIYISNKGVATAINTLSTAYGGTGVDSQTAKRLCYTSAAGNIVSGYHYADEDCVGIKYGADAPPTTLGVKGNITFTDSLNSTDTMYINTAKGKSLIFTQEIANTSNEMGRFNTYGGFSIGSTAYTSNTFKLYVAGNVRAEGGNISAYQESSATHIYAANSMASIGVCAGGTGNRGLYDRTADRYLLYCKPYVEDATEKQRMYTTVDYFYTKGIRPIDTNEWYLGTNTNVWGAVYSRRYRLYNGTDDQSYGYFSIEQIGSSTQNGVANLKLGNTVNSKSATGAMGQILLYGPGTTGGWILPPDDTTLTSNLNFCMPNTGGTFVTHETRGSAVGGSNRPVYIASTGRATAISSLGIAYGGTGATTASEAINALGGLEIISADTSSDDMDAYLKQGSHTKLYRTSSNTLNTPYKTTNVGYASALILSYASSTTYGKQVAFISGGTIYERYMRNGTISAWKKSSVYDGATIEGNAIVGGSDITSTYSLYIRQLIDEVEKSARMYWYSGNSFRINAASAETTFNYMQLNTASTTFGQPVAIGSGGTGATSKYNAVLNLLYNGSNSTTTTTDTPTYWSDKGYVYAYTGKTEVLQNQPTQYSFLQSFSIAGNLVSQIALSAGGTSMWIRGGSKTSDGQADVWKDWQLVLTTTKGTELNKNRMLWKNEDGNITATYHFVNSSQVSINSNSAPDSGYAFYVNGKTKMRGIDPVVVCVNTSTGHAIGTTTTPWLQTAARSHYISDGSASYGRYYVATNGTTDTIGLARIEVGNATASTNASNAYGMVRIYSQNTGYANIRATASTTTETTHYLPTAGGTLLNTNYIYGASGTTYGTVSQRDNATKVEGKIFFVI